MKQKEKYLFWGKLFSPLVIMMWAALCWLLVNIANSGNLRTKLPYVLGLAVILLGWFVWCFAHYSAWKKQTGHADTANWRRNWNWAGPSLFVLLSLILGLELSQSATEIGTHLNYRVNRIVNVRGMELKQKNVFQTGLDGLAASLRKQTDVPAKLYVSPDDPLKVTINRSGQIQAITGDVFGHRKKGGNVSYLINYPAAHGEKMTIERSRTGVSAKNMRRQYLLAPFFKLMRTEQLAQIVTAQNYRGYDIYYGGASELNTEQSLVDLNAADSDSSSSVSGNWQYNVAVYAEGHTDVPLVRFYDSALKVSPPQKSATEQRTAGLGQNEVQFFRNAHDGYRLKSVNAALGTYYYELRTTNNGGKNWQILNDDPFHGEGGVALAVKFLSPSLGFIGIMQNAGTSSKLYRTSDGGHTFNQVTYPVHKVKIGQEKTAIFIAPEMPVKTKNGLQMKVGQGEQGDYRGGRAQAVYHSTDQGETWQFVKSSEK